MAASTWNEQERMKTGSYFLLLFLLFAILELLKYTSGIIFVPSLCRKSLMAFSFEFTCVEAKTWRAVD